MVSLWPFRRDSSSTASFEKTLSTLTTKITTGQARLDAFRTSSRRLKALFTLYLSFVYLVYAIVLLLVVGYQNLGAWEWTGVAGGPLIIYIVRTVTTAYYNFRIDSLSARLKEHQAQRATTIQKLKDATKYDSTLELIEKYGGEKKPAKNPEGGGKDGKGKKGGPKQQGQQPQRLPFVPPPTANIQRPVPMELTAEFAPNADSPHQQHHQQQPNPGAGPQPSQQPPNSPPPSYPAYQQGPPRPPESHWYDRIFDVLLGEDETLPRNRIVLLCQHCRLVNGQAPPGTNSLSDVGVWRCMGCGGRNGETREDEGARVVREVLGETGEKVVDVPATEEFKDEGDEDVVVDDDDDESGEMVEIGDSEEGPAAAVRRRHGKAQS